MGILPQRWSSLVKRILIVEDAKHIQEATSFILKKEGYEVDVAGNGAEALAKVRTFRPEIVICDIMMPVMDGLTFLQAVRGNPETADLTVMMLTAKKGDMDILKGYNLGADYYITKPFSSEQLLLGVGLMVKEIEAARVKKAREG
ncbi:MAG: response regulator [Planctomycetota bacterium]